MNARTLLSLLLLGGVPFTVACDDEQAVDGEVDLRPGSGTYGGVWMNTASIGATAFSELDMQGVVHDGVRFLGVRLKRPNNVWLVGNAVEVVDGNLRVKVGQTVYQGADLVGSRWQLNLVDVDGDGDIDQADGAQKPVEMSISAHTQVSVKESRYVFEARDALGQVAPVCAADSAGQRTAVPIRNITVDNMTGDIAARTGTIYLACTSGALGKAVTWGYRPWERSLAELEVAARMVRADYCYDGTSWTETGTAVQVRDAWGINGFARAAEPNEAIWGSAGLRCVKQPRNPAFTASQVTCNGAPVPVCPNNVSLATYPGALYWTKVDD